MDADLNVSVLHCKQGDHRFCDFNPWRQRVMVVKVKMSRKLKLSRRCTVHVALLPRHQFAKPNSRQDLISDRKILPIGCQIDIIKWVVVNSTSPFF